MTKHIRFILLPVLLGLFIFSAHSQVTGDTIEIETFNYSQTYGVNQWSPGIRDTMINFPDDTSISYEKVLMLYNMRCKDGNVSPPISGQTDIGCGEWDISCNTYITDSSRVDSIKSKTDAYTITGFSGSVYDFSLQPTYALYLNHQKEVTIDSILNETLAQVDSGSLSLPQPVNLGETQWKSQYLFTQAELSSAGLLSGDLHGLIIHCLNQGGLIDFLRIRIKHSTQVSLTPSAPQTSGFTEVYFKNTSFIQGMNRLQFYTPFSWNGVSNIIVEFSFSNQLSVGQMLLRGSNTPVIQGLYGNGDHYFVFNGSNYIQAETYKGISGNAPRSFEAWIRTDVPNQEICSWGTNSSGEKWVCRLNAGGELRVEVNGGFVIGTTMLDDGNWHHIAYTFSGTNITNVQLYVDGVAEAVSNSQAQTVNTNTSNGINVRISRGHHNKYWIGEMDDIRIWSSALSASNINDWMYRTADSMHPAANNLELYYPMNEGNGTLINDISGKLRNAAVINGSNWGQLSGIEIFKHLQPTNERPDIGFLQGNYNLTITTDTLIDSVPQLPNYIFTKQVIPKWGSMQHDSIAVVQVDTVWMAGGYEYLIDTNGSIIDSFFVAIDSTITNYSLPYYLRYPSKYEIMSFVTPYGINLDLGMDGKTWTFDVTDYLPILKGRKRMTIERGGQWMEDMDIRFLFIVGTPPRDVHNINQLWRVEKKSYTTILSDDSFEPRMVQLNTASSDFKVRVAITGHGQQGEFIPRTHYININNGAETFYWTAWKECADNPIYPQGGTWIYDRAGWCPGAPTDVEEIDITPFITPGQSVSIDYGISGASGSSNYIVNSQLVSYGAANFTLDAAVIDVKAPSRKVEYARTNSICNNPEVVIRNTGSATLSSLSIEYWVNNASQPQVYQWTGSLEFMETESVVLPSPSMLWAPITSGDNVFHVEVTSPNSGTDEYSFNNHYKSNFSLPDVLPMHHVIWFKTNSAAWESKYQVFDDAGTMIFERTGMATNTLYKDTFHLPLGCYTLKVLDTDDDGIDFWANNDGVGYIQLREINNTLIRVLEPDFGKSIIYNYTIDFPLTYEELSGLTDLRVYPNPAMGRFYVEAEGIADAEIGIYNALGARHWLPVTVGTDKLTFDTESLQAGIYLVKVWQDGKQWSRKIVVR